MQTSDIQLIRAFNRFYTQHWQWLTPPHAPSGCTLFEGRVLLAVQRGVVRAAQLQTTLQVDRVPLRRTLKKLERQGWLRGMPLATDRRGRVLSLTAAGQTVVETLNYRADQQVIRLLGAASPEQITTVIRALQQIQTVFQAVAPRSVTPQDDSRSNNLA